MNYLGMSFERLTAISSVDGRYRDLTEPLVACFSEYALIRKRIAVECLYVIALTEESALGIRKLSEDEKTTLRTLYEIPIEDARLVKQIEREGYKGILATNHDVKAI